MNDITHECAAVYEAVLKLWFASGVERHAEGHPGISGPSSGDQSWSRERSMLDGAITGLLCIRDRRFPPAVAEDGCPGTDGPSCHC